ncbi:AbrB family transcriptional regulator, partial [Microbacteriaceae bacterium K1510]|nr:AbrB family transcriptional regulator [Microbacteriaceae bacterium K1510]
MAQMATIVPNAIAFGWSDYLLFAVVALAGAVGGMRVGLPAAILTGPLLATALVAIVSGHPAPEPAPILVTLSQIVFGIY